MIQHIDFLGEVIIEARQSGLCSYIVKSDIAIRSTPPYASAGSSGTPWTELCRHIVVGSRATKGVPVLAAPYRKLRFCKTWMLHTLGSMSILGMLYIRGIPVLTLLGTRRLK
jgi:hypothetical protein